jgi:ribosomal protein L16 Arg81 hydroxylase
MALKHSKYRNTGILFELLVRQTTSDLINNQDSKAVKILKKYYTNTELGKEYSLYSTFVSSPKLSETKADMLVTTIIEQYKKLDFEKINKLKYNLIKEIKNNYDLDNFFKAKIENYKPFASIYNIFESQNSKTIDTKQLILNKINLLEHLSEQPLENTKAPKSLVQEFMKEDKEIRLLAYKILVEKFNNKYKDLSDRQKDILKEYINNVSDTKNLKDYLNTQLVVIKTEITDLKESSKDQVVKIKLEEVLKFIKPIKENQSIKDEMITGILQYCDLIDELKRSV